MATRLNDRDLLKATPPHGKAQLVLRDGEVAGFVCVIGRKARTFAVDYRVAGKRTMTSIGKLGELRADGLAWTSTLARQRARELLGRVAEGVSLTAPAATGPAVPTLKAGLALHIKNMRRDDNSERSVATMQSEVDRYLADWLDRPISDLTAATLGEIYDEIMAGAKRRLGGNPKNPPGAAVANRVRRHVQAIWNTLDGVEELPGRNPARGVRPQKTKARESRIDDTDFAAWWAAVAKIENPVRRDLQIVALFTGVRSDGLRHARWEDFDEESATLWIARAKGDKPYLVPLSATVLAILVRRRQGNPALMAQFKEGDGGWIFPSYTRAKPYRVIPVAEAKISIYDGDGNKIRDPRFPPLHDLRRTFNSVAEEAGVPREAREMLMNHNRQGVNVRHYSVPQNWDYLASCASAIEAALHERIKGKRRARRLVPALKLLPAASVQP